MSQTDCPLDSATLESPSKHLVEHGLDERVDRLLKSVRVQVGPTEQRKCERLLEVTVKELCAKAGVNRSTLYAHYDGVYGLYDEAEGEFLDEIWDVSMSNSQARTAEQRLENYVNVCRFYRGNRQRLIVFYRQSIPGSSFADKILARLWTSSREHYTEHGEDVAREAYLLLGYGNAGYMHVIFSWLLDYPEMPAEEVARLLVSVHRGPSHILDSKQRRA